MRAFLTVSLEDHAHFTDEEAETGLPETSFPGPHTAPPEPPSRHKSSTVSPQLSPMSIQGLGQSARGFYLETGSPPRLRMSEDQG